MAKPKAPTAQELDRQRRQRELQERTAYLPPGLINQGNTCFMNSVLQGLIATRLLSDLVHFAPIPPAVQDRSAIRLAGQRSPQLTNGHNLSGPYEKPWVNTMPIGDVFLSIMYKSWDLQAKRQRDILSPRSLLGVLGKKYDQYLDFAQQDAHEFLRILLDAMRMEELDIIKKRQPPTPPAPKKRRRTTIVPSMPSTPSEPLPNAEASELPSQPEVSEDERLISFADLIFGGKLTSILVCQKCKNISQTYEDFNDISLSIKPEDYTHRKRDKLKNFAKRLTAFPSAANPAPSHLSAPEILRPSSVPPSPKERPDGQLVPRGEPPPSTSVRRRSLDIPSEANNREKLLEGNDTEQKDDEAALNDAIPKSSQGSGSSDIATESDNEHILVNVSGPEGKHIEFVEVSSKSEKKEKRKSQVEENWAKLGRRLSLSVGLGKPKDRKSRDKANRVSVPIIEGVASSSVTETLSKRLSTPNPAPRSSLSAAVSTLAGRTPSPDQRMFLSHKLAPAITESPRPSLDARVSSFPSVSSTSLNPNAPPAPPNIPRSKSPKPPKATAAEAEYLRKILADVSTGSSNPLSTLFRPPSQHHLPLGSKHVGSAALSPHNVWLGMNQLSGIEECLRMFTAVEVLDGENMVGCRRCWKIANGTWPKPQGDDDSDSASNENTSPPASQKNGASQATLSGSSEQKKPARLSLAPHMQTTSNHIPTSISTPTVSYYSETKESEKVDSRSISSLPTETTSHHGSTSTDGSQSPRTSRTNSESGSSIESATPGGLPIPVISTTGPSDLVDSESTSEASISGTNGASQPVNGIVAPKPTRPNHLFSNPNTASKDSLPVPALNMRAGKRQGEVTDDDESSAEESDTSFATSLSAESVVSLHYGLPPGLDTAGAATGDLSTPLSGQAVDGVSVNGETPSAVSVKPIVKKPSKPKPVIMRPAYKRYLIAIPPPVLVIHLKRFQQLAKSPFLSFSHGFKKLDDDISFPEHLDLSPFLAPKKEDYGLGKKTKKRKQEKLGGKSEERCMYRLYAVVVHIGNMLGGHYIAYTALPTKSPIEGEGLATKRRPPMSPSSSSGSAAATPVPAEKAKVDGSAEGVAANGTPASPPLSSTTERVPAPAVTPAPTSSSAEQKESSQAQAKPRQWAYISDTIVRLTTLEEVLSARAYICMYERC